MLTYCVYAPLFRHSAPPRNPNPFFEIGSNLYEVALNRIQYVFYRFHRGRFDLHNMICGRTPWAVFHIECYAVSFCQRFESFHLNCREVDKNIICFFLRDESIAFLSRNHFTIPFGMVTISAV